MALALNPLQNVGRVSALELVDDAVVDLPRVGRNRVEEPPVVRDDHERSGTGRPAANQVLGQPVDSGYIEVVGRLVEKQNVPRADEEAGEGDTTTLATGQIADSGVDINVTE